MEPLCMQLMMDSTTLKNSGLEEIKNYLRLTDKEAEEFSKVTTVVEFEKVLESCGVKDRWKKEADKAIKHLEELTGKKFKSAFEK